MWSTVLLDRSTHVETPLDDMPNAVRTYPASAGTVMLPPYAFQQLDCDDHVLWRVKCGDRSVSTLVLSIENITGC